MPNILHQTTSLLLMKLGLINSITTSIFKLSKGILGNVTVLKMTYSIRENNVIIASSG